jgi:hypothetical protein
MATMMGPPFGLWFPGQKWFLSVEFGPFIDDFPS